MKLLITVCILTLINLILIPDVKARNIVIKFPRGSYCGSYAGEIATKDTFSLNLSRNQSLIITNGFGQEFSVIAPDGKILPVKEHISRNVKEYFTGNQSGNFKVKIDQVLDVTMADFQFCAY